MKQSNQKSRIGVRVSEQTKLMLNEMCKGLGVDQSALIERLIINYRRGRFSRDRNNHRVRLAKILDAMSNG